GAIASWKSLLGRQLLAWELISQMMKKKTKNDGWRSIAVW
nr:hypothetical protein [Tanacetum cinerariifolium]